MYVCLVPLLLLSLVAGQRSGAADELALVQVSPADSRPHVKRWWTHDRARVADGARVADVARVSENDGDHLKLDALARLPKLRAALPINWVHVPKCGSSFLSTLVHLPGVCDESIVSKFILDDKAGGFDYLDKFDNALDLRKVCPGLMVDHFAHFGIDQVGYAASVGHLMIMLRQPEKRIMSAYSDLRTFATHHGIITGRTSSWGGWDGPLPTLPEFAWKSKGGAVRMLTRGGLPVGAHSGPPSAAEVELAVKRLREGFAFVGLTDRWALSMCLFDRMFGTGCHSWQFSSSRVSNKPGSGAGDYNLGVLQGVKDQYDGELYGAAVSIFEDNLKRYGVSEASCAPCWRSVGISLESVGELEFYDESLEGMQLI